MHYLAPKHSMNPKRLKYFLILFIFLTSCKSIQRLTSKDTSSEKKIVPSKNTKPVFIEQVSATPDKDKNAKKKIKENNNKSPQPSLLVYSSASSKIESVNLLQMKYSIITDINVEQLTNILLLNNIEKWWGTRYCIGGTSENCIDCSGFTQAIVEGIYNFSLPRTAQNQYAATERVSYIDLRQGDLVFFHTAGRMISHVGFYLGNNKFVHASTSSGVIISDLTEPYWTDKYMGGGRYQH